MHPAIPRMRPAQARARHLLDVHYGEATIDTPTVTTVTERDNLELAARQAARALLTQDMREWLEDLETNQETAAKTKIAAALSLDTTAFIQATTEPAARITAVDTIIADRTPETPTEPDTATMLHELVTLADWLTTAPITPPEPEPVGPKLGR